MAHLRSDHVTPAGRTLLLLCDDKPGHYHSAEGIAHALQLVAPWEVMRIEVRRPWWASPPLLASLVNTRRADRFVLSSIYGLDVGALAPAHLLVSAGGDTLAANVALARILGIPNIFYGSLRSYPIQDFSLVLNSAPERSHHPRELRFMKPSPHDPRSIPAPRAIEPGMAPRVALLIGGDSGTFRYQPSDWKLLLELIGAAHSQHGVRWLVSNSRRTPGAVSDQLQAIAAEPDGPIAQLVDVRSAGPGTLIGLLGACDGVVCTADSSSMLTEAIWLRRPVVAVRPKTWAHELRERDYRDYLEAQGWCHECDLAECTPTDLLAKLKQLTPMSDNPRQQLARLVCEHLPSLRDHA
jgi:hypothetical protein